MVKLLFLCTFALCSRDGVQCCFGALSVRSKLSRGAIGTVLRSGRNFV